MKKIINHLIQLQELAEAKAQQKIINGNAHTAQLDEAIATLQRELPADIARRFTQLQGRSHNAIVPVYEHVCSGCGMGIPVSLTQAVKTQEHLQFCPNCACILYALPATQPKQIADSSGRSRDIGIARFSSPKLMISKLQSNSRDDVLKELSCKMKDEEFIDDCENVTELALRREAIISTAVEHGIAFPHVRAVEGGGLTMALGIHPKGVDFGGKTKTKIIFFIVIPTAASAFYLKLLSGLTETFQKKTARDKLLNADDNTKLWKALVSTTKKSIP